MAKLDKPDSAFTHSWRSDLDGRTAIAQVMTAKYNLLTDDLGGHDNLSYQKRSLVERVLWLEYWLSEQEKDLATGGEFDVNKWIQGCNSLQGIYAKLGLNKQKNMQDLSTYLQGKKP